MRFLAFAFVLLIVWTAAKAVGYREGRADGLGAAPEDAEAQAARRAQEATRIAALRDVAVGSAEACGVVEDMIERATRDALLEDMAARGGP